MRGSASKKKKNEMGPKIFVIKIDKVMEEKRFLDREKFITRPRYLSFVYNGFSDNIMFTMLKYIGHHFTK